MAAETGIPPEEMLENVRKATLFLKGLANKNRLMILCSISRGELNVRDLEARLGIRQPTLSQQLGRLRADGLVATRRESKSIYYSLASEEAGELIGLVYKLFCDQSDGIPASTVAQ